MFSCCGFFFMAALRNRCGHYIFALWYLSFFLSFFPRLISAATDWRSTILLRMAPRGPSANLECRSEMWRILYAIYIIMVALWNGGDHYIFILSFVMAALWNRAGHYIFALWFLSSSFFFSSPNLSGRWLDVYHTSIHGVALVRI